MGCPTGKAFLSSGAQDLTLLPRLPGLPGPAWPENRTFPPLSFCAWVSQLCSVVLGSAAPPRCAVPDSAAARTGRPRRATAVSCSRNRFCSLSWWGYKVSPVKRTKFLSQPGRVGPIVFCKVRPTQGRWAPVTGSGVGPVEAEGAARGRFGLTPAAFLSPRSHHGKAQRSGFAVKRRSKGAQRGIPIYGSPESKRTLRRRVAAGKVTRPAGRNLP